MTNTSKITISVSRKNGTFYARCQGMTVSSQGCRMRDLLWAVEKLAMKIKLFPYEVGPDDWARQGITITAPKSEEEALAELVGSNDQARQRWFAEWTLATVCEGYKAESGKLLWTGYENVWGSFHVEKYDPMKHTELIASPSIRRVFAGIEADSEADAFYELTKRKESGTGFQVTIGGIKTCEESKK